MSAMVIIFFELFVGGGCKVELAAADIVDVDKRL